MGNYSFCSEELSQEEQEKQEQFQSLMGNYSFCSGKHFERNVRNVMDFNP